MTPLLIGSCSSFVCIEGWSIPHQQPSSEPLLCCLWKKLTSFLLTSFLLISFFFTTFLLSFSFTSFLYAQGNSARIRNIKDWLIPFALRSVIVASVDGAHHFGWILTSRPIITLNLFHAQCKLRKLVLDTISNRFATCTCKQDGCNKPNVPNQDMENNRSSV